MPIESGGALARRAKNPGCCRPARSCLCQTRRTPWIAHAARRSPTPRRGPAPADRGGRGFRGAARGGARAVGLLRQHGLLRDHRGRYSGVLVKPEPADRASNMSPRTTRLFLLSAAFLAGLAAVFAIVLLIVKPDTAAMAPSAAI